MKDKLFKMRKHVDWYSLLISLEDQRLFEKYNVLCRDCNIDSRNRISYLAFRMVFPKAKLDYYRATSDKRIFTL